MAINLKDLEILYMPNRTVTVIAPSMNKNPNRLADFRDEVRKMFPHAISYRNDRIILQNGSVLYFISANSASSLRGLRNDRVIWLDKDIVPDRMLVAAVSNAMVTMIGTEGDNKYWTSEKDE